MKITKDTLKKIIKEEYDRLLKEEMKKVVTVDNQNYTVTYDGQDFLMASGIMGLVSDPALIAKIKTAAGLK